MAKHKMPIVVASVLATALAACSDKGPTTPTLETCPKGQHLENGKCVADPVFAPRLESVEWTEPGEAPKVNTGNEDGLNRVILGFSGGEVLVLLPVETPVEGKPTDYKGGPSKDLELSKRYLLELRDDAFIEGEGSFFGDPVGTTVKGEFLKTLELTFRDTEGKLHVLKDIPLAEAIQGKIVVYIDIKGQPSWTS